VLDPTVLLDLYGGVPATSDVDHVRYAVVPKMVIPYELLATHSLDSARRDLQCLKPRTRYWLGLLLGNDLSLDELAPTEESPALRGQVVGIRFLVDPAAPHTPGTAQICDNIHLRDPGLIRALLPATPAKIANRVFHGPSFLGLEAQSSEEGQWVGRITSMSSCI
jgi:hypothetical protein